MKKKLVSLTLAIVAVLSMNLTAFAASPSASSAAQAVAAAQPAVSPQQQLANVARTVNTANSFSAGSVTASSNEGFLPAGGYLTSSVVTSGAQVEAAAATLGATFTGAAQKSVMEIDLKDSNGTDVHQLAGYVNIAVPKPFEPSAGNTIITYLILDGRAIRLNTIVTNDAVIFTTNHCSTYVFVEVPANQAVSSPKTAEFPTAVILLAVAAVGVAAVAILRKRA